MSVECCLSVPQRKTLHSSPRRGLPMARPPLNNSMRGEKTKIGRGRLTALGYEKRGMRLPRQADCRIDGEAPWGVPG